jgi:hypothetical protein
VEKNTPEIYPFWFIVVLATPAGARQKKCGGNGTGTGMVPGKKKRREGVPFLAVVG